MEEQLDPLPVRQINEYAYCPRLFYLMYVQGRWDDNAFTVEGKNIHRRIDKKDTALPTPDDSTTHEEAGPAEGDPPPTVVRSVPLDSASLNLTGKLDLVSVAGHTAVPVETKRGKAPDNERRSWEPERVQLMAQGLLLREHGYTCNHGVLYFFGSRTRVDIPFDQELEERTRMFIDRAFQTSTSKTIPPPLDDSPKCAGCSLAGICLPDETKKLTAGAQASAKDIRRLFPVRDDALPFYVQEQGARVGKEGQKITVKKGSEKLAHVGRKDVSQLVLLGNIAVSAQTVNWLCRENVPIVHMTMGHWFCGMTSGISIRNAYARSAQYQTAASSASCLDVAKAFIRAKGGNQRTMLRRNALNMPPEVLRNMSELIASIPSATSLQRLLGIEGSIAAAYFANFSRTLSPGDFDSEWAFTKRNRRPPKDPVNALLSFAYAMLTKECTVALLAEGLDPWWGFYHQPRHGRPSLALDLMEEFRPVIADSAVLTAINTSMVKEADFMQSASACILKDKARKAFIRAYESRMDQLVTHPLFGYRCSWRSIIRLQARLLSKWISGEIPQYMGMTTR